MATACVVRLAPQWGLAVFNSVTDYQLNANKVEVRFWPFSIRFSDLEIIAKTGQTLAQFERAYTSYNWITRSQGHHDVQYTELSNGEVFLYRLPPASNESSHPPMALDIHRILSAHTLQAEQLKIAFAPDTKLFFTSAHSNGAAEEPADHGAIKRHFAAQGYLQLHAQQLDFDAQIASQQRNELSHLTVALESLDLRPLAASSNQSTALETVMDWQWLSQLSQIDLTVHIGVSTLANAELHNSVVKLRAGQDINLDVTARLISKPGMNLPFTVNESITLHANLSPLSMSTLGADVDSSIALTTNTMQLGASGAINLNGPQDTRLQFRLESNSLPEYLKGYSLNNTRIAPWLAGLFPLHAQGQLTFQSGQIELQELDATLGSSSVSGQVSWSAEAARPPHIAAKIHAPLLVLPTLQNKPDTAQKSTQGEATKLLSSEAINWDWVSDFNFDLALNIDQLKVADVTLQDLSLSSKLQDQTLEIIDASVQIGSGSISHALRINALPDSNGVKLDAALSATELDLKLLNVLPELQWSGALLNAKLNLASKGASPSDLAQQSTGKIHATFGQGVIGNDSFELIASDALLGLLNKLNPFTQSDPSTELECAVVHLKFANGMALVDQSLAMRTAKIDVVANGNINLATEEIDLSLKPRARSGIGVDAASLVKFVDLGGSLSNPEPKVSASGVLQSTAVVGAAISTGGASLIVTSLAEKALSADVCARASSAFEEPATAPIEDSD